VEANKMSDLSITLAGLIGVVNIQREAMCILLNPPPTSEQVQVAFAVQSQKLKDIGLGKQWDDEHLDAYCKGIDSAMSQFAAASLKASLKNIQNLPPSLTP